MLVLTDRLPGGWGGFLSYRIKALTAVGHGAGHYNHAMWVYMPGVVATQGWRFGLSRLEPYLEGRHRVKIWWSPTWTENTRRVMFSALERDIERHGKYDWLGILGQRLRRAGLNWPGRDYCSEEAGRILRVAEPGFAEKHPTPADLDRWCREHEQMVCYGVFDPSL